jgi:ABC-type nitrate/sulfonate/bicarbonate transport system substrate-binding protein
MQRRLLLLMLTLVLVSGCNRAPERADGTGVSLGVSELRYLGGQGNVSFAELGEDLGYLAPLKLKWVGNVLGGPEAIQAVTSGDVEFGSAATGSVVKLLAAGAPIEQVMASGGVDDLSWGGYFVLENSSLRVARDTLGKKFAVNTLGAHAEFMIREWLRRGNVSQEQAKQVTLVVSPPANSEQMLRQGQVDVAGLSGVLRDRALERGGIRPLFTDRDLFGNFNATTYVMRKSFIAEHPDAARQFVSSTARAIEWARKTPPDVVRARLRDILQRRNRGEDPSLAKFWHSVGIRSRGGLLADQDVQMWIDWLTREGDLQRDKLRPVSELYSNAFNPYRPGQAPPSEP